MPDERPLNRAEANTLATVAAGGTEVLPAGSYYIKAVHFFNGTAGGANMELHDHATAATDPDPVRAAVAASRTISIEGPFRFTAGVRAASSVSNATCGVLVIWKPLS